MQDSLMQLIALGCAASGVVLLGVLSAIDLRVRLLPNIYVLPLALLGIVFHIVCDWYYLLPMDLAAGALVGGGILYGIRMVANRIYGLDALGLGDVKLMAAAGVWLGVDGVLLALIAGAVCGLLHGLVVGIYQSCREKRPLNLNRLEVPAGPGFAVGIIGAALYQFVFSHGVLTMSGWG